MAGPADPQVYVHVRIVMGMIIGLSVARILSGVARFIQHPQGQKISRLHLGWAASTLLDCVLFWWWEYRLATIHWTFLIYFFVLFYASMFYFKCVLLFPDHLGEYASYQQYFYAKRRWFFGLLAVSTILDLGDTLLKGLDYAFSVWWLSGITAPITIVGSLIAMRTRDPRYHAGFLILTLSFQVMEILTLFYTL